MTLESIYYLSQIVSSVAVLASLIYLALQTRQNTRGQRAMMHQMRIQQMQSDLQIRADPSIAAAIIAAETGANDLTDIQRLQLMVTNLSGLISMEEQFRLHKSGQFDSEHWSTTKKTLAVFLRSPGSRVIARIYRGMFDPDFAAVLDQIIDETRVLPYVDRRLAWNAMMQEELRLSTPATAKAAS